MEKKHSKRVLVGITVSDKMDKTVVVRVDTKKLHPLYKKYVTRSNRYKVHDEKNDIHVGDRIKIEECRPISKEKYWRVAEVVERAR